MTLIQTNWSKENNEKTVTCIANVAKKYKVDSMLTVGKTYQVVNETDEFIFVVDNSNRIAGYYKDYFQ